VLCSGKSDNGRGLARTRVFTHNHEVLSGRTSCISHNLIHFGKKGEVIFHQTTYYI
jgi:GTPase